MSSLTAPVLDLAVDDTRMRNVRVLALRGELDLHSSPRLKRLGERLAGDRDPLVLDLSELMLLDSSGLGAIIELFNATQNAGAQFAIVARRSPTRRIFDVTGLTAVLGVVQTRRDAVARVSAA